LQNATLKFFLNPEK